MVISDENLSTLNIVLFVLNLIILLAFMTVFHVYDTYPSEQLKTSKLVLHALLNIAGFLFLLFFIYAYVQKEYQHNKVFTGFSIIVILLSIGYSIAYHIVEDKPVAQQSLPRQQRSFQQPQPQQPQQPINHLQMTQKTMTLPMTENILTSSPTMYDKVYSEFTRVKNKYL